jgi:hypothetical protein
MTDFSPPPAPAVPSVTSLNTLSVVRYVLGALFGLLMARLGVKLGIHLTADQQAQFLDFAAPAVVAGGSALWIWLKNRNQKAVVADAIMASPPAVKP